MNTIGSRCTDGDGPQNAAERRRAAIRGNWRWPIVYTAALAGRTHEQATRLADNAISRQLSGYN